MIFVKSKNLFLGHIVTKFWNVSSYWKCCMYFLSNLQGHSSISEFKILDSKINKVDIFRQKQGNLINW